MKLRSLLVLLLLSCLAWVSQAATHYTLRHYGAKEGLRAPAVNCLAQDMDGFIWIGSNMGLTRFDGAHFRTFALRHDDAGAFALQPRSIAVDTLYRVWVGTKRGLFLFDIRTERFRHFEDALIPDGAFIRHVALDPSHRFIWVQEGERLLRIDVQSRLVEELPPTEQPAWEPIIDDATAADIDRYLKGKARVALVDRDGGYWATSFYDGLYYLHACRQPFRFIPQRASEQTTPIIRTLCRVTDDQLYVGTENAGLFLLNPQADNPLRPVTLTWQGEPLPLNIQSLCADDGTLWVGTIDHGLYAYDLLTHRVVHHFDATNGLTQSLIVCLHRSRQGDLFAGTVNGLFRLDRSSMKFSPVAGAETGFIHALAETQDGTLWIGALDNRLRQLKSSTADTIPSFTYPCVTALTTDALDNLYIGTDNRGIWLRSSQSGAITPFPLTGEHLRSSVNHIVFDAEGRLWASSFNGLFCYDQRDSIFSHYDHTNVLPTDFFNYQSGLLLSDSLLVLGTYQGLLAFNPHHFHPSDTPLQPFFTNVCIGERDTIAPASLTLPYNTPSFSIDYAVPTYAHAPEVWYRYRTLGTRDTSWTIVQGGEQRIRYSHLPPGRYRIELQATMNPARWREQPTEMMLHIKPPFWLSTWAYTLYALILIALFTLGLIIWHNRSEQRKLRQQIAQLIQNQALMREAPEASPYALIKDIVPGQRTNDFMDAVDAYLEQHVTSHELSVDTLAETMHTSASTLYRRMKATTSLSPNEYIRLYRLKRAARMLRQERLPIREVSERLCFSSVAYFTNCFSRQFGITPGEYVK